MDNPAIARHFLELAKLMEFHKENQFRIRSYTNAYSVLKNWDEPLGEMTAAELKEIDGVGEKIQAKIQEISETGKMNTLEKYKGMTPPGIQDLLKVRGLGPKKLRQLYDELGLETAGELLYACYENRLLKLKGFGQKTQANIVETVEAYNRNKDRFLYSKLIVPALELIEKLNQQLPKANYTIVGDLATFEPIVDSIAILTDASKEVLLEITGLIKDLEIKDDGEIISAVWQRSFPVQLECSSRFKEDKITKTSTNEFLNSYPGLFKEGKIPPTPELRTLPFRPDFDYSQVIDQIDLEGLIHCHSQYSDGGSSIKALANHAESLGYSYLGLTDHSQIAVYANGLNPESLEKQWAEIDALNHTLENFTVLKGIECDILNDGSLDYEDDVRSKFDFVLASVHSNHKMDEKKATSRLIKAIEHPDTHILGHITGRILLARKGYPLDMEKIMDACVANKVAIELNANPYRLDIDWQWIPRLVDKGVWVAINPDAHSLAAMKHNDYGLLAARKGLLPKSNCLNTLSKDDFLHFCGK